MNTNTLAADIQKAINGEYSAIACYEKLAELAPTSFEREKIEEIRNDEQRHYDAFSSIYTLLTGAQPQPEITEPCANTYQAGIQNAFRDEQETVDFYLDIADQADDASFKETFRRAAADEQNHAVWFLSFMNQPQTCSYRQNEQDFGAKGALNAESLTFPEALVYAMQDEYLAQSRYDDVLNTFGSVRTFERIKQSELRHIEALNTLFDRYQIPVPVDDSANYVTTPESLKAAYAAGVQAEKENIAMYEKFLSYQIPADARVVFSQLRSASLNHLAAFERGAGRE